MLRIEVMPAWKGRAVSSLTRRDCRALVQASPTGRRRSTPTGSCRCSHGCFGLRWKRNDHGVARRPLAETGRRGVESGRPRHESLRGRRDADRWAGDREDPGADARRIYRLGLLTGQRPGEITGMEWPEIDGAWWTVPGARTKNGARPSRLSDPAGARRTGARDAGEDEPRVFRWYRGNRQQSRPVTPRCSPSCGVARSRGTRCATPSPPAWPSAASRSRTSRRCSTTPTARV